MIAEKWSVADIGLRKRVTIVVFMLVVSLCICITLLSYFNLKKQLFGELRSRLANLAYTGSFIIDGKSLKGLVTGLAPGLDYSKVPAEGDYITADEKLELIEKSEDFLHVCADLNTIRDAQPDLLLYAYVVIPTSEKGMLRFVADADAPSLLEEAAAGSGSTDDITRYGKLYDAGADSIMAEAADKKLNTVEKEFSWDEEGKSNIFSGYAPVVYNGEFLGLLGLDISDKNADAILKKTIVVYALICAAAVAGCIFLMVFINRMISRPLNRLVSSLRNMADGEGNLTAALPVEGKDELGQTAFEFNRFTGRLREAISEVKIIVADLNSSTAAIKESIDDLTANLNLQTGLEQEVSIGSTNIKSSVAMLAMNADVQANGFIALTNRLMDLSRSISSLADESRSASRLTEAITGNIIRGKDSLNAASTIMESISRSSDEMTGIAGMISDISDQINLLSLNAAIESARAGEAGRGFAVVADEISKLADKTAYNVKDIDRIIQGNSRLIAGGMQSVNSMVELFGAVIGDVGRISSLIVRISSYMDEQAQYNDQVHRESETMKSIVGEIHELVEGHGRSVEAIINSLDSISRLSSGNSSASEAINNSAGEITKLSDSLLRIMNYFKVGTAKWQ